MVSSSFSLSHIPFCERMANTPTHSKHPGHTTSKRGQTLLQSPSAEKVFLVTTAQHMTRSFQTELSITRSSASCSCLTTLTSVLSVSTAQTAAALVQRSLTPRTELSAPTQRATQHPRCCPCFKIIDILKLFRHLSQGLPATFYEKKSSASAAGASAVRYDDATQRAGSFITASQIKNRGPNDSRHARQKTIFTRLATVQFERVPGSWRES